MMKLEQHVASDPLSYEERPSGRIDDYIDLVVSAPNARHAEFSALHAVAGLIAPRRILEFSAEGLMLERFYPDVVIDHADLLDIKPRENYQGILKTGWGLEGIATGQYDAVLSMVPIHHATAAEQSRYLQGALRVLRPGGILAFGEVDKGSMVHEFLDNFVDAHSLAGHRGAYPDATFVHRMTAAGFQQVSTSVEDVSWRFASVAAMCAFMTRLFALRPMPTAALVSALQRCPGFCHHDGEVRLNWSLRYFRGCVPC